MKNFYYSDGSPDYAAIQAEAHRLRSEVVAGYFRKLFSSFGGNRAPHGKTV